MAEPLEYQTGATRPRGRLWIVALVVWVLAAGMIGLYVGTEILLLFRGP